MTFKFNLLTEHGRACRVAVLIHLLTTDDQFSSLHWSSSEGGVKKPCVGMPPIMADRSMDQVSSADICISYSEINNLPKDPSQSRVACHVLNTVRGRFMANISKHNCDLVQVTSPTSPNTPMAVLGCITDIEYDTSRRQLRAAFINAPALHVVLKVQRMGIRVAGEVGGFTMAAKVNGSMGLGAAGHMFGTGVRLLMDVHTASDKQQLHTTIKGILEGAGVPDAELLLVQHSVQGIKASQITSDTVQTPCGPEWQRVPSVHSCPK